MLSYLDCFNANSIKRINRAGTAQINACGDSRLRGLRSRKPIGFRQWVVHSWNNRFRISTICVFDETYRNSGIGTKLIHAIEEIAISLKVRMIVLETQTCNEKAIAFYRKNGYAVIGFDLYSYSNHDLEDHEVRIEMGKKVKE